VNIAIPHTLKMKTCFGAFNGLDYNTNIQKKAPEFRKPLY
jgi:hypothetical protein